MDQREKEMRQCNRKLMLDTFLSEWKYTFKIGGYGRRTGLESSGICACGVWLPNRRGKSNRSGKEMRS